MAELREWDTAAANNNNAPPNGFPENMNYSEVNNAAREVMAVLARYERDTRGTLATGGTADAITLTPVGTYAAYFAGMQLGFTAGLTNTGAVTVNVSALGAIAIVDQDGSALAGGEIVAGGIYQIIHDGTQFRLRTTSTPQAIAASTLSLSGALSVDLVDSNATLVIGPGAGSHIEIDGDDIQRKTDATTAASININRLGGNVSLGPQSGTGQIIIYHDASIVAASSASGWAIRDGSGDTPILQMQEDDATASATITSNSAGPLVIHKNTVGHGVRLSGRNVGNTADNTGFEFDPDGAAEMYNTGVLRFQTDSDGATVLGDDLRLDNTGSGATRIRIFNSEGGFMILADGDSAQFLQTDNAGTDEDTWIRFANNAEVQLYHNNVVKLSTAASGIAVSGTLVDVDNSGADTQTEIQVRNLSGGIQMDVLAGGNSRLIQTAANGVAEDVLLSFTRNSNTALHHNGLIAMLTDTAGIIVRDTAGDTAAVTFQDSSGNQEGTIFTNNGGDGLTVRSNLHGGVVRIDGEDAVGAVQDVFVADPDGASQMFHNGVAHFQTAALGAEVLGSQFELVSTTNVLMQNETRNSIGGVQISVAATTGLTNIQQINSAGSSEDIWIEMERDGYVELRHAATRMIRTQSVTGNGHTTGATIRHHDNSEYDIGMNVMPLQTYSASFSMTEADVGMLRHKSSGGAATVTLPSGTTVNDPPLGAMMMLTNQDSENLTIDAAGSLFWYDGGGSVPTAQASGQITLAPGGICTVYHATSTSWYVWGNGLS